MKQLELKTKAATSPNHTDATFELFYKGTDKEIDWIIKILRDGISKEAI